jgi:hypothetical protein
VTKTEPELLCAGATPVILILTGKYSAIRRFGRGLAYYIP